MFRHEIDSYCCKTFARTIAASLKKKKKVVGHFGEGYVEFEYHQGGVLVVNHLCPMDPISFGIPNLHSPRHLRDPLPKSMVMRVMVALFVGGNVV